MDDLSITAGGVRVAGWKGVRVTAGIERCTRDFEISLTERFPDAQTLALAPGMACEVRLGEDLVLTGYIDTLRMDIGPESHGIVCAGRGKTQDLLDCSAEWESMQMQATTVTDIATKLAAPYGIDVICDVPDLKVYPKFNILKGEAPFEVIERVARYSAVLAHENADGALVLSRSGKKWMGSGFQEGENIESASVVLSSHLRFSRYVMYGMNDERLRYFGAQAFLFDAADPDVKRNRQLYLFAEQVLPYQDVAKQRLQWEVNRRIARSQVVMLTTDSWRDAQGLIWEPNRMTTVCLPSLKIPEVNWVISEVSFRRDAQGTHADLVLMSPAALDPTPTGTAASLIDGYTQMPIGAIR